MCCTGILQTTSAREWKSKRPHCDSLNSSYLISVVKNKQRGPASNQHHQSVFFFSLQFQVWHMACSNSFYFSTGWDTIVLKLLCNWTISKKIRWYLPLPAQEGSVVIWRAGCKQQGVHYIQFSSWQKLVVGLMAFIESIEQLWKENVQMFFSVCLLFANEELTWNLFEKERYDISGQC